MTQQQADDNVGGGKEGGAYKQTVQTGIGAGFHVFILMSITWCQYYSQNLSSYFQSYFYCRCFQINITQKQKYIVAMKEQNLSMTKGFASVFSLPPLHVTASKKSL